MKTFRIPEPEWAQAMFNRLKTMISNLKSSIDGAGYITQETDPTVPAWAKAANKPTYTASEVGAVSNSDVANNLTTTAAGKVLDARQGKVLKDLIDGLTIPTKTSELTNDSGFLSGNDVANNLTTTTAGKVLDARQGKALKDLIDGISVPTKTSDLTNDGDGNAPFLTAAGAQSSLFVKIDGYHLDAEMVEDMLSGMSDGSFRFFAAYKDGIELLLGRQLQCDYADMHGIIGCDQLQGGVKNYYLLAEYDFTDNNTISEAGVAISWFDFDLSPQDETELYVYYSGMTKLYERSRS